MPDTNRRPGTVAGLPVGAKIAVVANPVRYPEIFHEFGQIGVDAIPVSDGDPIQEEWDVLFLYRSARTFHRYEKLLSCRAGTRPRTILWQHEPLFPECLSSAAGRSALEAARFARSGRWRQPVLKVWHRNLYKRISETGLGPYSRSGPDGVPHWKIRAMSEACAFIDNGYRSGWLDRVVVSTIQKQRYLASRGIPADFAPTGLSDAFGANRHVDRDIDVLFLGDIDKVPGRRRKLTSLEAAITAAGYRFEKATRGQFGEARTRLLNRTKIILHLHNIPWDTPWKRWFIATANGAMVASENLSVPEPFVPGVHYVEAPFDSLAETILDLLGQPERIRDIAATCQSFVRTNMQTPDMLRVVLNGGDVFAAGHATGAN